MRTLNYFLGLHTFTDCEHDLTAVQDVRPFWTDDYSLEAFRGITLRKEAVFAILAIVNIYASWRAAKYQEGGTLRWHGFEVLKMGANIAENGG